MESTKTTNPESFFIVTKAPTRVNKHDMATHVWVNHKNKTIKYPTIEKAVGEIADEIGKLCQESSGLTVETANGESDYVETRVDAIAKIMTELKKNPTPKFWVALTYSDDSSAIYTVNQITL